VEQENLLHDAGQRLWAAKIDLANVRDEARSLRAAVARIEREVGRLMVGYVVADMSWNQAVVAEKAETEKAETEKFVGLNVEDFDDEVLKQADRRVLPEPD
jgi:hypothetical protein